MKRILVAVVVLAGALAPAFAENWPGWRGPRANGVSTEKNLPLEWTDTTNVLWKVPLPEKGNSSPIVWNDRVFITQALEKKGLRTVMCFDRADGKLLWQEGVSYDKKEPTHGTNPYASATPVTDGQRVIASFGSAGLVAYDFAGKQLWHKDLGEFLHIWGNAASPILYENLVILNCGPGERTFLIALDKTTGAEVWKVEEPGGKSGLKGNTEWIGSWSTPVVAKIDGKDQLVMSWPKAVKAYDPHTGELLWNVQGLTDLVYTSPLVTADLVVAMSGYGGSALALVPQGTGDLTESKRLWLAAKRNPQRIGSGILLGDIIYMINEPGSVFAIDVKSGEVRWNESLGGNVWSSPVLADGRIYVTRKDGETVVLAAKPEFEILSRNPIREETLASPAISEGRIYLRTYKNLYCIGEKK